VQVLRLIGSALRGSVARVSSSGMSSELDIA
jgi:hypothetical protein